MNTQKEIQNLKLAIKYFSYFGFKHGFWSVLDGLCRRLNLSKLYAYADKKRYDNCKCYLRKKYGDIIQKYKNSNLTIPTNTISPTSTIWVFWWQGMQSLPYPVNLCIESIKRHAKNHPVIVITKENYEKYVRLPSCIMKKFNDGLISVAHFSDILRFELLYLYGGIWLDSTYYVSDSLDNVIYDKNFFSISNSNGRKWVVTKDIWSVSFLAMTRNHPIAAYMRDCFRLYWDKENIILAYLLVDCFISIGYEDIPMFKKIIDSVPENNIGVFDLLNSIRNKVCTKEDFEYLMGNTYIHKLTYKQKYIPEVNGAKTYFGYLISN